MRWTPWKSNRDEAGPLFLVPVLALFSYGLYLAFLSTLGRFLTGDEPGLILNFLPLAVGLLFPAVLSLFFLGRTRIPRGLFVGVSALTIVGASLISYFFVTRNCTPTTCDDGGLWFLLSGIVILGLMIGVTLHKLAEILG